MTYSCRDSVSTDQRECGFLIVGLFICPFVPKKCGPKIGDFWLFCTGSDLWNQKNRVRRHIDLLSMGLVALLLLIKENVFLLIVGLFVSPFVPKKCGPKMGVFWLFCRGPDLWNRKIGSDETLNYSPWDW